MVAPDGAAAIAAWTLLKPGVVQLFSWPPTVAAELTHRDLGEVAKAVLGRTTSPAITTIDALTSVIVARLSFILLLLVGTAIAHEIAEHGSLRYLG
jgi:hypothetical protein